MENGLFLPVAAGRQIQNPASAIHQPENRNGLSQTPASISPPAIFRKGAYNPPPSSQDIKPILTTDGKVPLCTAVHSATYAQN